MSWRSVVITKRCKLDLSMNYMVIRGEETKRIFLDEIAILIIENNAISITACLLTALTEKKVKIIFCDNERNPQTELVPYNGCHNDSIKIKKQIEWNDNLKKEVWRLIVVEKILNQAKLLKDNNKNTEAELLKQYTTEVLPGDSTNREGHAAKVYFNALFGMKFTRSDDDNVINAALNYGYSIILSAFNREVSSNGYLNQLGLFHDNQFNHFNLACDLMEPFRPLVDKVVCANRISEFTKDEKYMLIDIINQPVRINGTEQTVLNAIKIYCKSIFDALNEENQYLIKFIER